MYQTDGILPLGVELARRQPLPRLARRSSSSAPGGRKRGRLLHRVFCEQIRPAVPEAELWMVAESCEPAAGVRGSRRLPTPSCGSSTRAWALCLPSSYEGLGIPYLEAMAQGIPVVASSNPGSRMLLEQGRRGIIAADDELGQRLIELLREPVLRARWASAGTERAKEFSWERIGERHEEAYRAAIERHRRR